MPNFDRSRQIDLQRAETALNNPETSPAVRKKIVRMKHVIREQKDNVHVASLRKRYLNAVAVGDAEATHKLGEQLKKVDERLGFDRRQENKLVDS